MSIEDFFRKGGRKHTFGISSSSSSSQASSSSSLLPITSKNHTKCSFNSENCSSPEENVEMNEELTKRQGALEVDQVNHFRMNPNGKEIKLKWHCPECTFLNEPLDKKCSMCNSKKECLEPSRSKDYGNNCTFNGSTISSKVNPGSVSDITEWACSCCTFLNDLKSLKCSMCNVGVQPPMDNVERRKRISTLQKSTSKSTSLFLKSTHHLHLQGQEAQDGDYERQQNSLTRNTESITLNEEDSQREKDYMNGNKIADNMACPGKRIRNHSKQSMTPNFYHSNDEDKKVNNDHEEGCKENVKRVSMKVMDMEDDEYDFENTTEINEEAGEQGSDISSDHQNDSDEFDEDSTDDDEDFEHPGLSQDEILNILETVDKETAPTRRIPMKSTFSSQLDKINLIDLTAELHCDAKKNYSSVRNTEDAHGNTAVDLTKAQYNMKYSPFVGSNDPPITSKPYLPHFWSVKDVERSGLCEIDFSSFQMNVTSRNSDLRYEKRKESRERKSKPRKRKKRRSGGFRRSSVKSKKI